MQLYVFAKILKYFFVSESSISYICVKCRTKLPGNLAYSSHREKLIVMRYNSNAIASSILRIASLTLASSLNLAHIHASQHFQISLFMSQKQILHLCVYKALIKIGINCFR